MTDTATRTEPSATTAAIGPTPTDGIPDPRPAFTSAVACAREIVAGVRPDQLDLPTPCEDFDVRTLGHHILGVLERLVVVGRGDDPTGTEALVEGVADDEWLAAFDGFSDQIEAVWGDDAVLTNILTLPWTQLPGAVALLIYLNEVSVHTWDLATATRQMPVWDDDVLETALAAIRFGLPAEGREHPDVPFAAVVDVAPDAPVIDRLVAWNGRRP